MAERRTKSRAPAHERHLVRNQSERRGPILAVVVHSTESADIPGSDRDLEAIRAWFDDPQSQASSHIGIDGQGNTEQWVLSNRKAWTCGAANSWTLNIEFIGRASQPAKDWEEAQIKQGARWLAYWAHTFGIPIQRGRCNNVHGQCVCITPGVLRHKDISEAGFGTHTDPGPMFPMNDFLDKGRWYFNHGWTT